MDVKWAIGQYSVGIHRNETYISQEKDLFLLLNSWSIPYLLWYNSVEMDPQISTEPRISAIFWGDEPFSRAMHWKNKMHFDKDL